MVEAFSHEPYVPNSVSMGGDEPRCKIITGPNMGGWVGAVMLYYFLLMTKSFLGRVLAFEWSRWLHWWLKLAAMSLLLPSRWDLSIPYWRGWEVCWTKNIPLVCPPFPLSLRRPCARTIYVHGRDVGNEWNSTNSDEEKSRHSRRTWSRYLNFWWSKSAWLQPQDYSKSQKIDGDCRCDFAIPCWK